MFAPFGALLGNRWDYLAPLSNTRHLIVHHLLSELFFSEPLFTSFLPNKQSWIPNKEERPNYLGFVLPHLDRTEAFSGSAGFLPPGKCIPRNACRPLVLLFFLRGKRLPQAVTLI